MPSATPQEAQAASQQMAQDPQFQQYLQKIAALVEQQKAAPNGTAKMQLQQQIMTVEQEADNYRKSANMSPHDYSYNFRDNTLNKDSFFDRNPWVAPLLAGAGAVAAPLAFSALGGAGVTAGATTLPSTQIGTGVGALAPGATSSMAAGDAAGMFTPSALGTGSMSGVGGGVGKAIGKVLGKIPGAADDFGNLGKMTGALQDSEADNRYEKAKWTQGYDRLKLDEAENRRKDVADANRNMAIGSYLQSGGSSAKLSPFQLNGQTRTPVDFGMMPRPATDAQKQQGGLLQAEMLKRLQPGGSYQITDPGYLNRGKLEKAGQWGNLISGGIGIVKDIFGK